MLKGEGQVAWETDGTCRARVLSVMSYTAGTRSQEHFTRKPLLKAKQHSPPESLAGDACEGKITDAGELSWDLESRFFSNGFCFCHSLPALGACAHLASEHSRLQLAQE